MRIAICLTSEYYVKRLMKILITAVTDFNCCAQIKCFKDVKALSQSGTDSVDYVICDVKEFDIAQIVAEKRKCKIIFLGEGSNSIDAKSDNYIYISYGFTDMDIEKSIFDYDVINTQSMCEKAVSYICSKPNCFVRIPLSNIFEISSCQQQNKRYKVKIVCFDKTEYYVDDYISNINDKYSEYGLVRIHRGVIIPSSRIKSFSFTKVYTNENTEYPLGRQNRSNLLCMCTLSKDNQKEDKSNIIAVNDESSERPQITKVKNVVFRLCIDGYADNLIFGRAYCEYTRNRLVFTNMAECLLSTQNVSKAVLESSDKIKLSLSFMNNGFNNAEYDNIRVWNSSTLYKKNGLICSLWLYISDTVNNEFSGNVTLVENGQMIKMLHFDSIPDANDKIKSIILSYSEKQREKKKRRA